MKIVFDARGIRSGMTGVGIYSASLIGELCTVCPDDDLIFLGLRDEDPALRPRQTVEAENARWIEVDVDPEAHPRADFWMHRALPGMLDDIGADLFHGPAYVVPFHTKRSSMARVVTLADLSVFTMPSAYPLKFRIYLRWAIARSVAAADRVLCLTEFGRQEALALFKSEPPEKFVAAPLAADPACGLAASAEDSSRVIEKFGIAEPFLLMVGTLEPRKNPLFFREFYEEMRARQKNRTDIDKTSMPMLVWAGKRGHKSKRLLAALDSLRDDGLFRLLENVDERGLAALYQRATALVYPSMSEGFGLPLIEAASCGLPLIASDTTCLSEVVGEGGACLPLTRPDLWVDAVELLLADSEEHERASARALRRAAEFSWRKTALTTARAYADALESVRTGKQ